jgi:hypothetical protein
LRRAFEMQSIIKWNIYGANVKEKYLSLANGNVDMAKDMVFMDWLDMPFTKKEMNKARKEYDEKTA